MKHLNPASAGFCVYWACHAPEVLTDMEANTDTNSVAQSASCCCLPGFAGKIGSIDEAGDGYPAPAPIDLITHTFGATSAKCAPCGSMHCTIQEGPGTSMGPSSTWPPAAFTRSSPAWAASTLM